MVTTRKNRALRANRRKHPKRYMWYRARARSKIDGTKFSITLEDFEIPKRCPVLGLRLAISETGRMSANSPSLDRIDPRRGYVRGNVQVICQRWNRAKCDLTLAELKLVAKYYGGTHEPEDALDGQDEED